MASAIVRSSLRSALRSGAPKRSFSSGASVEEEAREASKWEKITYLGAASCTILAFVNLSKGHPHFDEPPPYPYLHIRNKEFPWGDVMWFQKKHDSSPAMTPGYPKG
ncbi:cytochrome c oxidase subunit 6A, mitochondrial [Tanacetum coccineum]